MDLIPHLLALGILSLLLLKLWSARSLSQRAPVTVGPTGPPPEHPGAWPIIGHLHLMRDPIPQALTLGLMADRLGPVFLLRFGVHPALIISSHEVVRECFTTHDRILASRPGCKAAVYMGYNYAALGFARYGPYWRQIRKLTMLKLLGAARLENIRHVQETEIDTLLKDLYHMISADRTVVVGISQWFEHLTLKIITMVTAGKRYFRGSRTDNLSGEASRVRKVIKEFMNLSGFPAISDLIPYTGWTDFVGSGRAMKKVGRELDSIVDSWVMEHEARRISSNGDCDGPEKDLDFIDEMLSEIENNSMFDYSRDTIIKATVMNIIAAGSDTTSLNLTWALSLLLNHKHLLDQAQEELDHKVGRDRWVQHSDIENLSYLHAIVKETLRMYPPGPLSVPHEGTEDCVINGYLVPKGTWIMTNLWKLHRDPRVWTDPERFWPERFLKGHSGVDVLGQHFELIPFGSGRRSCPGAAFALQVTRLTLARLLQGFNLSTPSGGPVDMTEGPGFNLPKASPLEVTLTPRLSAKLYEEPVNLD